MPVTAIILTNPEHNIAKTVYDNGLERTDAYPPTDPELILDHEEYISNRGLITTFTIITPEQVGEERDRRLALGFMYDFGDSRGTHHIGTTENDLKGWDEVTKWSSACIALGLNTSTLNILTNTGPTLVSATEWQQILLAATAARQPFWAASFVLQSQNPIPMNYTDDSYWP